MILRSSSFVSERYLPLHFQTINPQPSSGKSYCPTIESFSENPLLLVLLPTRLRDSITYDNAFLKGPSSYPANTVNTERWGLRDNSDTACPLLTLPPRHRAPGSQWRDERVPLGACGQGGEGQAETQPENEASLLFCLGGG